MLTDQIAKLLEEIESTLGTKHTPNANQLVISDGFDVLEKERAVKFFSRKTFKDVLEHLQRRKNSLLAGADYQLEEWSVLNPSSRYYYLRAYLEYLLEALSEKDPDGQYISDLFHQLYQTVYMYGIDAYSEKQKVLLRNTAAFTLEKITIHKGVEDWSGDVAENVSVFLSELKKYE